MLIQQMTSKLASPFSASQPNTKGLESSIWVGMKSSAHQAAPRGPPWCSFPVLFSLITKATPNPPKSLCFWQGPATFHGKHSWIPAKPRVGTQVALGQALSLLHQQHQILCHLSGAQPHPHPHNSYWGWRKLGKHWFQHKRVERIETSLLPASQAL